MSLDHNQSLLTNKDQIGTGARLNLEYNSKIRRRQGLRWPPLEKLIDKVSGECRYQFVSFLVHAAAWFLTAWLLLVIAFFFDDTIACQ